MVLSGLELGDLDLHRRGLFFPVDTNYDGLFIHEI